MGKRWLWRIVAALALLSIPAGAAWRAPGPGGELPQPPEAPAATQVGDGEGCARLGPLEPVDLVVGLPEGRTARVGTGFRDAESGRVLAPVRRLVTPLAPGPLGVVWDDETRTVSMLREGEVLSVHLPEGRDWSAAAVLNGEVVGAEALLCQGRLYVSLRLLADGLGLRYRWRDARSILVEPR